MKRQEIIDRIKEIVREKRTNGVLNLISKDGKERSLYIRNDKIFYVCSYHEDNCTGSETYPERNIYKFALAAILFEIGNDADRKNVRDDMTMQDYAYLINKLGIVYKTLEEIRKRKSN